MSLKFHFQTSRELKVLMSGWEKTVNKSQKKAIATPHILNKATDIENTLSLFTVSFRCSTVFSC